MECMKSRQKVRIDSLKNISKPARAQILPIIPESRSEKILSKHWINLLLNTQR